MGFVNPREPGNAKRLVSVSGVELSPGPHQVTIMSLGIWTPVFCGLEFSIDHD